MIPNMPYQNNMANRPPMFGQQTPMMRPLATHHMGMKTRKQHVAAAIFWFIIVACYLNLNSVLLMLTGMQRLVTYALLLATLTLPLMFNFRIGRDLGKSGKWYLAFLGTYFLVGGLMALGTSSTQLYTLGYYYRLYGSGILIVVASAMGARHIVVAFSVKTLFKFLYIIGLLVIGGMFLGLYWKGMYAYIGGGDRAMGFYLNPNQAGFAVCYAVVCIFTILTLAKKTLSKILILSTIPLAAAAVFVTYSRTGIIIFIALCGIQFFLAAKKNRKLIMAAGLISVALMVGYILTKSSSHKKHGASNAQLRVKKIADMLSGDITKNSEGRLGLVGVGLKKWLKSPVFGNGLGSQQTGLNGQQHGVHNLYVMILGESGIIGAVLFILFFCVIIIENFKHKDPAVRVFCFGAILVFALAGATTHGILYQKHHDIMLGICFGALSGVKYLKKTQQQTRFAHEKNAITPRLAARHTQGAVKHTIASS